MSDYQVGAAAVVAEAAAVCCQRFVVEAALVLTEILSYQNLFVVSPMVRSINYFWVLPTFVYTSQREAIHFRVLDRLQIFDRWSSSSTILTLMAWRSNILQKSFVRDCSSLLKNDLRFTRRWQSLQLAVACCAFCALYAIKNA